MGSRDRRIAGKGDRIEIEFLEALRGRCPSNERILEALGELYTRTGRYEDGLNVDLEITKINPRESVAWYNLGCSYALVGRREDAFEALQRALKLGYRDIEWMMRDSDLDAIRSDPRFKTLIQSAKSQ